MTPATYRLVLLVSLAHALVHVFELSLPSVEQMIGDEYGVGPERTGVLGTAWRLPFGLGALLAGWLADRFGSKPLLIVYLLGCAATAFLAWSAGSLNVVFIAMVAMGCFASIYHPAGLAIISRETNPENRGAALGWHGILGSLGIASAPFLAAVVFSLGGVSWRQYYLLLIVPAVLLALFLAMCLKERCDRPAIHTGPLEHPPEAGDVEAARWGLFFALVVIGALAGFIYAAFMHFLPRYLDGAGLRPSGMTAAGFRNSMATVVLLCAVAGQALAGRIARPGRLEGQLALILLANAPALVWVAVAEGQARLWATCTLAFVHFMNQPIYNSLIAQFVPRSRRSVGYGFSNMLCFGIGALGPAYAGYVGDDLWTYGGLAVFAATAGTLALILRQVSRRPAAAAA